jgi:PAS domain S-box-containing protein
MANPIGDAEAPHKTSADIHAAGNETVIEGQKKALELAVHGAPLPAVLDVIVRTIQTQSSNDVLGSILLLDAAAQRLRHGAAPSLPDDYNAAIDGIPIGPAVGSCGTAAFTGKTVVVSDVETDPLWADFKALALQHGLRACWSTPILSSQGAVLGTFALYHRFSTIPTARDRAIVELLTHTAALVIERDQQARQRAAAEAALRAAGHQQIERVSAMFEHAPAAIAVLRGPEQTFETANPKYREIVGGRSVVGKTIREALPELEGQGFYELLDGVYRTGEPYIGRSQRVALQRGAPGALEECFFDFVYQPIPTPDGKVDSILAVAFEVTETVKAKVDAEAARARAEESERSLKTFVDNLPELAWTAQADGRVDYYNRRWYEYTGTTFEEMQGWGWEKVHDPELLPKVVERWKHSLATGDPFEMEFTLRGADGVPRWFLTRVTPSRDASGKIIRWFGTCTNIHEIKAAQALTEAVAEQSRDAQRMLLQMRAAVERAERRVAELEAERQMRAQ